MLLPTFKINPQFQIIPTETCLTFLSLQQRDKRIGLEFKTNPYDALGLTVLKKNRGPFRTSLFDLTSRLAQSTYTPSREVSMEVKLEKGSTYVVIPHTYSAGVRSLKYFLSIYTQKPLEESPRSLEEEEPSASIKTSWGRKSAGGCPNTKKWVRNPQFILESTKQQTVDIVLEQSPINGKLDGIGIYVWPTNTEDRIFSLANLLHKPERFVPTATCSATLNLSVGRYLVMPCTFNPRHETNFQLKVNSQDCSLRPVSEKLLQKIRGAWKTGCCGGSGNWSQNPRYTLELTTKEDVRIMVSVKGAPKAMGWIVTNASLNQNIKHTLQLSLSATDVVTLNPGKYVILPFTQTANDLGEFVLRVWTSSPASLK
eukprot:TRINITY_DN6150_c0_g4_i2.p1 TRINITY_DN6150_c0_g4~~TRINITY_DN6150_c0_g4_i2.p1  ORF type:complete len:370 (+),score=76.13 TRINITY_DN6150_c0_g4_i2:86-1195(+)